MRLETTLLKGGIDFVRRTLCAGLASSLLYLTGCCLFNTPPKTEVTKEFTEDGKVKYHFSAKDSEGSIDHISVVFNNLVYSQDFPDNSYWTIDIIEGQNTVEAIAYDNCSAADPTPAEISFYSPTEQEARTTIDGTLAEISGIYVQKDASMTLGESETTFRVDYLITTPKGDRVVNYVSHTDNREKEAENLKKLSDYYVPAQEIIWLPKEETKSKVKEFVNKN